MKSGKLSRKNYHLHERDKYFALMLQIYKHKYTDLF